MPPFLLGESYGDAGMGMARLLGFCFAVFLVAPLASAANIIDLGPSDYRSWGSGSFHHHSNGINSKNGQTIRMPPMNTNLTVTRNPVIPYGSIANGAKNFVRVNPASIAASAAITALFLGLDWVFDDQLDSWMKEGEDVPIPVSDQYYHWSITTSGHEENIFSSPMEACQYGDQVRIDNSSSGRYYETTRVDFDSSTRGYCRGIARWDGYNNTNFTISNVRRGGTGCPPGSAYSPSVRACLMPAGNVPLTESDWAELESSLPNAPATTVGQAAGDTMQRQGAPLPGFQDTTIEGPESVAGPEATSTSTDPVTGDTIVTNTQTTTNISYGDTTITTTNTTTATTYQNGQETSTTVTTETPGELPVSSGTASAEWPGFCEWASVVCDWFNWTQEEPPPEQDLPSVIDDDFYQEKTISFGAKSCPPDHQIDLAPFLATSVAVSFQPLCDFAGLIYYMVMAASYIIAAYITIGVARNG